MKNKSTIILIILCIIAGCFYIKDVPYDNNSGNYNININQSKYNAKIDLESSTEKTSTNNELDTNLEDNNTLININTASKEELVKLPGIGDVIAENIINYRENVSMFNNIEEIKNVERIGDKTYEKIKELITIE